MSDYTPSTDDVREAWRDEMFPNASDAAFNRWLAARDATVRADHEKAVRERIARNIEAQGITARDVPQDKDWMAVVHTRKADARIAREGA